MVYEQGSSKGIKWNEITWYSRLGAIILLLGIIPALSFYIGTQYQSTLNIQSTNQSLQKELSAKTATQIPSKVITLPIGGTQDSLTLNSIDFSGQSASVTEFLFCDTCLNNSIPPKTFTLTLNDRLENPLGGDLGFVTLTSLSSSTATIVISNPYLTETSSQYSAQDNHDLCSPRTVNAAENTGDFTAYKITGTAPYICQDGMNILAIYSKTNVCLIVNSERRIELNAVIPNKKYISSDGQTTFTKNSGDFDFVEGSPPTRHICNLPGIE
ncbi:MAG TPA: hypothetical protein VMU13_02285 [Candidatus Paceibacterota bacterium]|nr:hypothetical protein [Candidatus Paceibacterota bacterium]